MKARTYPPLSATQSANTEKVSAHVSGGRSAARTEREGDSARGGAGPAAAASRGDDAIARERRAATTGPLFRARASGNGPRRDVRHESPDASGETKKRAHCDDSDDEAPPKLAGRASGFQPGAIGTTPGRALVRLFRRRPF